MEFDSIEKELLRFWKIKSITNPDGSDKTNRSEMYTKWTSNNYYVGGLRPKYYVDYKGYILNWTSFSLEGEILVESRGNTSLVNKITPTDDGFIVYTMNSIYTFVETEETFDSLLQKQELLDFDA